MEIHITTLSENTAGRSNLLGEWGLSVLVEADGMNILFDTGQSISAGYNADILGIDLSQIDKIVLSHSHPDHTGGLRQTLRKMRKEVEIIAHPDVWADKYIRRQNQEPSYFCIPFKRQELESLGATFNLTTKSMKITDSIMTTGEIPMITDYEQTGTNFVVKGDAGWQPDKILDDQALIINTEPGLVVILGCSHRGIINTLYHAQQLTGGKQIHAVLGGAHLVGASEERLWMTIAALRELGVQRLGLCHCTSLPATAVMIQEFGDTFFFNNAGTITDLP